jgi:hypothetical protein
MKRVTKADGRRGGRPARHPKTPSKPTKRRRWAGTAGNRVTSPRRCAVQAGVSGPEATASAGPPATARQRDDFLSLTFQFANLDLPRPSGSQRWRLVAKEFEFSSEDSPGFLASASRGSSCSADTIALTLAT